MFRKRTSCLIKFAILPDNSVHMIGIKMRSHRSVLILPHLPLTHVDDWQTQAFGKASFPIRAFVTGREIANKNLAALIRTRSCASIRPAP